MKEIDPRNPPNWFRLGNALLPHSIGTLLGTFESCNSGNINLDTIARCATIHFEQCLRTSVETNRDGRHAIAIALLRQCVEALTIIDVSLQPPAVRDPLLTAWFDDKKTAGQIRKDLEIQVWPNYGTGLWTETWTVFFAELAKAVQPYAHYTHMLQKWQHAVTTDPVQVQADGSYKIAARIGLNTYDAVKATRITLFHFLLAWAVARLLLQNKRGALDTTEVHDLGTALGASELLGRGTLSWSQEFYPLLFDKPSTQPATD